MIEQGVCNYLLDEIKLNEEDKSSHWKFHTKDFSISTSKKIQGIKFVNFDENDVVRHKLVKDIIKAYGDNNGK